MRIWIITTDSIVSGCTSRHRIVCDVLTKIDARTLLTDNVTIEFAETILDVELEPPFPVLSKPEIHP